MADKRTTPEAPEGAPQAAPERSRRKKRAAPTIDLTATEVPPAQGAAPQPDSPPQPDPAAQASAPSNAARAETAPKRSGSAFGVAALAGGAAGVTATLLILLALYVAGLLPLQQATSTTTTQAGDNKTLEALTQRIGKIEQALGKIAPGDENMTERLAAVRSSINSLSTDLVALYRHNDEIAATAKGAGTRAEAVQKALTELNARVQELAKTATAENSAVELGALQKRIAALEQSTQLARADIAKASSADLAARMALSAASLRDAVTSGAPFAAELTQVKALGGDDKILAPLGSFAANGLPAAPALAHELNAQLPAMIKIANASAPRGGFVERLEANAHKLMRFHPINAPTGDDASLVLARLEIDTSKADIAAALDDLAKLDSMARAPAQAWIAKAQARQAALAAVKQFAANTARALGPKAGAQ